MQDQSSWPNKLLIQKKPFFLLQKWNNKHVHPMQGRLHSSLQQGQWSIITYLDSEEVLSTVFLNRQVLGLTASLQGWQMGQSGCYTLPAVIQDQDCRKHKVHTHEVGFLGLSRSMEPVGLWQEGRIGNAGRVRKRHDKNVVTKYH